MTQREIGQERAVNLWSSAARKFPPLARATKFVAAPEVGSDQIGGLADAQEEVLTYACTMTNREVYTAWGTFPPSGLLLIGQHGCGKSLLAEALATRAGAGFLRVEVPRLALELVHHGGKAGELLEAWSSLLDDLPPTTVFFHELEFTQAVEIGGDRTTSRSALSWTSCASSPTAAIGFARRFASYKRGDLTFKDIERLGKILSQRWLPVQIIFAGKAHPSDDEGKRILQRIFALAHEPSLGGRIAFVENYDEQLAQYMVHGVDLWLNNPIPPLEACGTSGMKASLNGVPQLSILDGWWREGFNGKDGWAFEGKGNDEDAEAIYTILEREIVPLYYVLDDNGVPNGWVEVMKEAIKSTGSVFSTRRMAKEYALRYYQNALKSA